MFAASAVSHWIEHQTGWSIKKFVHTERPHRAVHIRRENTSQLRPLLREYFPAAFEEFQGHEVRD
jgi:hypothetical protein